VRPDFDSIAKPSPFAELAFNRFRQLSKKYRALSHPLRYMYVDASAIHHRTRLHQRALDELGSKAYDIFTVKGGDWDVRRGWTTDLHYDPLYTSVYAHFVEHVPWDDTPLIDLKLKIIAERGRVDNCTSREALLARYRKLDETFLEISRHGFKRQDQIVGGRLHEEIFVSVGRFGTPFLASGGNHRLAIAKLLNLRAIPCLIMTRHEIWQDLRESYFCAKYNSSDEHTGKLSSDFRCTMIENSFDNCVRTDIVTNWT